MIRISLVSAHLNSPMHCALSNTKYSNWRTMKPCASCKATLDELWNADYNIVKNRRTVDKLASDSVFVEEGDTLA